jgi:hypothetical protein
LWEKVDRRDSAETDEGCSGGVRRWRSLEHPLYLHGGDFVRWKRLSLEPDGHPIRGLAKSPDTPAATTVDEPGIFAFVTHDRIVAWLQSHAQGRLP